MDEIDVTNKWIVGTASTGVVILCPPERLTPAEALVFAAYVVLLSGATNEEWEKVKQAVENT